MTISDLTPTNLKTELNRFYADKSYNPQFDYTSEVNPEYLEHWGQPLPINLEIADHLIRLAQTKTFESPQPHHFTETEIRSAVSHHMSTLPPEVGSLLVFFDPHQIPRCRINRDGLIFRTNLVMTEDDFAGLLRHEIDTHFLRHYNQIENDLSSKVLPDYGRTEEGFANINMYLFHPRPLILKSALRYKAAASGKTMGFAELYQSLVELGVPSREALRATLRVKRGLKDTSQPGVTTKDIIYLDGTMKVLKWLQHLNQALSNAYIGQVSLERLQQLGDVSSFSQVVPHYMKNETEYLQAVSGIVKYNELDSYL